jgi:hypothetical protein
VAVLVFPAVNINDIQLQNFTGQLRSAIALSLNIPESWIYIISIFAGSVRVDWAVEGALEVAQANSLESELDKLPEVLGTELEYGKPPSLVRPTRPPTRLSIDVLLEVHFGYFAEIIHY